MRVGFAHPTETLFSSSSWYCQMTVEHGRDFIIDFTPGIQLSVSEEETDAEILEIVRVQLWKEDLVVPFIAGGVAVRLADGRRPNF